MITHITKDNRAKYIKLFAKATEALKASNSTIYPENFSISSLEEYFQNLEELFNLDPKFLRLPVDEEMFEIDLNTRLITIPASFKKSGLGVQGDDLAEMVYFKVDRYFDATDLNETFIMIQWEAPSGKKMVSPAYFQEVDSEIDKLIFGWAITKEMTSSPGTLKFSIVFVDGEVVSADGYELNIQGLDYRLGTLIANVNINAGLSIANQGIIKFENRLNDLKNRIKNSPLLGGIVDGVADFAKILDYNYLKVKNEKGEVVENYKWKSENIFSNIFTDLIDNPNTEETETGLTMIAVSPNAGLISYEWYKENPEDLEHPFLLAQGPGALRYFPVTYPESEKLNESIYFIKEGEDNFRFFDEGIDSWTIIVDEIGTEVINPLLYERVAFVQVDGPGKYFAKIKNKEGMKISILDTSNATDNGGVAGIAIIPEPTEIDVVSISSSKEIFSEEEPALMSSLVTFPENEPEYANLKYQWLRNGEIIEGATENIYSVVEEGDYSLKVVNHWNKAISAEVTSNILQIYPAAIKPEIISFSIDSMLEESDYGIVGGTLTVNFKPIDQFKATQFVEWYRGRTDDIDDWELIEGAEGLTYTPDEPGDYKARVYNFITDKNKEYTDTEIITVVSIGNE